MGNIILHKKNERVLKVRGDLGVLHEMQDVFSFFAKGYKFHPSFKNRLWDGKIRLLNLQKGEMPAGLIHEIKNFAEESGYNLEIEHDDYYGYAGETQNIEFDEFATFVKGLDIRNDKGPQPARWRRTRESSIVRRSSHRRCRRSIPALSLARAGSLAKR